MSDEEEEEEGGGGGGGGGISKQRPVCWISRCRSVVPLFIFFNKFQYLDTLIQRKFSECLSVRLAYLLLLKRFNGQVISLIYWFVSRGNRERGERRHSAHLLVVWESEMPGSRLSLVDVPILSLGLFYCRMVMEKGEKVKQVSI